MRTQTQPPPLRLDLDCDGEEGESLGFLETFLQGQKSNRKTTLAHQTQTPRAIRQSQAERKPVVSTGNCVPRFLSHSADGFTFASKGIQVTNDALASDSSAPDEVNTLLLAIDGEADKGEANTNSEGVDESTAPRKRSTGSRMLPKTKKRCRGVNQGNNASADYFHVSERVHANWQNFGVWYPGVVKHVREDDSCDGSLIH
jgi:hypothetical protein